MFRKLNNGKLTVPKWMLINRPKIPQMPQNLSALIVCPSPKVWDFDKKKASLGVRSPWTKSSNIFRPTIYGQGKVRAGNTIDLVFLKETSHGGFPGDSSRSPASASLTDRTVHLIDYKLCSMLTNIWRNCGCVKIKVLINKIFCHIVAHLCREISTQNHIISTILLLVFP